MTLIRQQLEAREQEILAPQSARSADTRGRLRAEAEDDIRPAFQRDRDRVIHSKAFRRLKHKTQVFFSPAGDHYRTRLTHTLEVSQIARTIAKVLHLHEELTEAIALGHDLGHTPFGHAGERVLDDLVPGGFNHYEQSLRVVDVLENDGRGLNLTWEVRDGIAKHSKGKGGAPVGVELSKRASTLEGQIARVADLVAYVNHDIDDSVRAGLLKESDLPASFTSGPRPLVLRANRHDGRRRRLRDARRAISPRFAWAPKCSKRRWGFASFSLAPSTRTRSPPRNSRRRTASSAACGRRSASGRRFTWTRRRSQKEGLDAARRDFIAGMTDRYAVALFEELYIPRPWLGR